MIFFPYMKQVKKLNILKIGAITAALGLQIYAPNKPRVLQTFLRKRSPSNQLTLADIMQTMFSTGNNIL